MKTLLSCSLAVVAFAVIAAIASPASAASGTVSGTVTAIRVQDAAVGSTWFTLSGTTTIGQCVKNGSQTESLIPNDTQGNWMLSVVEAALLSGKSLTVWLDDGNATSSIYCVVKWLSVSP